MQVKRVEHVAIAVRNLEEVMRIFQDTLGLTLEYQHDYPQYRSRMAMYPVGETYLELLQGTSPDSDISRWLADKGQGLYHICLEVTDIDAALAELKAKGVRLLDETAREGHANSRIAFLDPRSTGDILIELLEPPGGGHGPGAGAAR